MTDQTDQHTVSEFLLARVAEDEEVARAVGDQGWLYHGVKTEGLADPEAKLRHSDRWMPSRVLAECEAKRRVIEHVTDQWDDAGFPTEGRTATWLPDVWLQVLKLMALPYADHSDFLEEWRS